MGRKVLPSCAPVQWRPSYAGAVALPRHLAALATTLRRIVAALPEGRASTVPQASRLDPFGSDIGARSFGLDPFAPIVANGLPHCSGFLMNGNDVRYGPHVDSALVDLAGHLKIILCDRFTDHRG